VNHSAKQPSAWRAYLALLRPPNLVTAVADVLAGYAVAGLGHHDALAWLIVATVCLYGGGVVLNDFFDRRLDARERPERPIPSGRVAAAHAAALGGSLLAVGVVAAACASRQAGAIALGIAGLAAIYDAWGKHHPVLGPLNIASCRALNLLLGVALVPAALTTFWMVALIPFAYISGVTVLSRGEVHGGRRAPATFALLVVAGVVVALAFMAVGARAVVGGLLAIAFAGRVLPAFWRARQDPSPMAIRFAVRTGVLSLLLLDATIAAVYAGAPIALVILALAPIAWLLARPFAVT
jgi:4-hydroxybenzoate polyprenyltransferase